jgi:hypothetical protein
MISAPKIFFTSTLDKPVHTFDLKVDKISILLLVHISMEMGLWRHKATIIHLLVHCTIVPSSRVICSTAFCAQKVCILNTQNHTEVSSRIMLQIIRVTEHYQFFEIIHYTDYSFQLRYQPCHLSQSLLTVLDA